MPSSATITTFYSFQANTKARATQVNANFDVFRGHIIPFDPNTVTGSNNTYDLGSTEYSWRKGYIGEVNLGATSTSWRIKDNTTTGNGDLLFQKNSVDIARINSSGFVLPTATIYHHSLRTRPVSTNGTDTSPAGVIISSAFSANSTGTSNVVVTGSTITISTQGRPVVIGFMGSDSSPFGGRFQVISAVTTTGQVFTQGQFIVYRNQFTSTSVVCGFQLDAGSVTFTAGSTSIVPYNAIGPCVLGVDPLMTTGSNTYFISMLAGNAYTSVFAAGRLYAYELY